MSIASDGNGLATAMLAIAALLVYLVGSVFTNKGHQ